MMNKYFKSSLFLILIFTFSMTYGQKRTSPWTKTTKSSISQEKIISQKTRPVDASYYQLDMAILRSSLKNVPLRDSGILSNTLLDFPNSDGSMEVYRIMEYAVMDPELQAKFPKIRSYVGYGYKNASAVVYFSISPNGLHSMKMSMDKETEFINPYSNDGAYEAFSRQSVPVTQNLFECGFVDDGLQSQIDLNTDLIASRNANDGTRRTFRLAVGTSIEYTNFHGGTVASALAAINTTMTRVNGIYDRELSIRMTLVANNDLLISTTGNSIFSNGEGVSGITALINGKIGETSYDIGHTFTTGSGGSAYLRSVCGTNKGGGTTGLPSPLGDAFAVDFVAHEIGHQFGATHTFNGSASNCGLDTRTASTAYEPGSGSTILSYAGICSPQNVQNKSSDYFHQASLRQIWRNITVGESTCGTLISTGNSAPTAEAGASYNIPISTPYKLTGASTDTNGTNTHTYTWEQFDLGPTGTPKETNEFGPMVRSFQGTSNPVRYIPRFEEVLSNGGTSTTWEKLASVGRTHNFVLTVRDNDARGGQTAVDNMTATTIAGAGPFKVTSQTSAVTWEIGAYKTISWDVANTDVAPINTTKVNIKLSLDGGATFPIILASNIPNDGSHDITVPDGTVTNKARILIEGAGNIFYNVNTSDFKIISVKYLLNFSTSSATVCKPNAAVYNFIYNSYQGYNQSTRFSATNLPAGASATFSPASASSNGTPVTMTISGMGNVAPGAYEITATGTSGTLKISSLVTLNVFSNTLSPITTDLPANGADGLSPNVVLTWKENVNTQNYFVEVSTTSTFSNVVASANVATNSYMTSLDEATVYYWRVTGSSQCATAAASAVSSFSTYESSCNSYTSIDTPVVITEVINQVSKSVIPVTDDLQVVDINVKVNISHTWVADLKLVLISPTGTRVVLSENNGDLFDENYTNTIFDQEASTSIIKAFAPFTGTYSPEGDLSTMYNEKSAGTWTLEVTDTRDLDGGSIDEFTLELCLAKPLSIEENSFEGFAIFPNPNSGEFTVKLKSHSAEDIKVAIYDIRGRKILENRFDSTTNFREVIRLDKAQSGMYLIHITDGLRTVTKRVLVN